MFSRLLFALLIQGASACAAPSHGQASIESVGSTSAASPPHSAPGASAPAPIGNACARGTTAMKSPRTTFPIVGPTRSPTGGLLYGLIDARGKLLAKPSFDEVFPDREGMVAVRKGDKWGYADTTGRLALAPKWLAVGSFSEGLAAVVLESKPVGDSMEDRFTIYRCGFIDKKGAQVITPAWLHDCGPFRDGRARWVPFDEAQPRSRVGSFIDRSGAAVVSGIAAQSWDLGSLRETGPYDYREGFVFLPAPPRLVDVAGKPLTVELGWVAAGSFTSGLARVQKSADNTVTGFIDKQGELAFATDATVGDFHDGLATFKPKGGSRLGFLDSCGKPAIAALYGAANDFSNGYAVVTDDAGAQLLIDTSGRAVSKLEYAASGGVEGGLLRLLVKLRTISNGPPPIEAYVTTTGAYVYVSEGAAAVLGEAWLKSRLEAPRGP
jgi:hypothetical protein